MKEVTKYWWLILLKGIILIGLAIFIFNNPIGTLVGLALYIGISLMITGFFLVIIAFTGRKVDENWGWKLTEGLVDIIIALILLSNPGLTAATFPFVVGFWIIFYGITLFTGSFSARKTGDQNWWVNLLGGVLNVIFGFIIMNNLFAGALAITVWIGIGVLDFGAANISIALRMRSLNK